MPIVLQKKVTLFAMQEKRNNILVALQRYGKMHIEKDVEDDVLESVVNKSETVALEHEIIDWAISELKPLDLRKKPMLQPKDVISFDQLKKNFNERKNTLDIAYAVKKLEEKRLAINSKLIRLENLKSSIEPWIDLQLPVEAIKDTENCRITAGTVPTIDAQEFYSEISDNETLHYQKLYADKDNHYVFLIYHNSENEELSQLLSRVGYSSTNFSNYEGVPRDVIVDIEKQIEEIQVKKDKIEAEKSNHAKALPDMERLLDALMIETNRKDKADDLQTTQYVFKLHGFIPAHLEEELREIVAECAGEAYELTVQETIDTDDVPTLYENRAFVRPFESITDMFGKSKHTAMDPNVTMAPFFAIFFGMMMSDAGYGLIIAVLASFIYFKTKPKYGDGNKLIRVIAISGVFTIFWGILYGGYMGFSLKPLLFNPMQEPMLTLGLCLLMGVIHIIVGLSVRAATLIKRGQVMNAISQQFTWISFIAGLVMFALPTLAGFVDQEPSTLFLVLNKIGTVMLFAGLGGIIVLGGHGKKGLGRIFGGLSSLSEITGYMSDILSYSRLFGLGLATGVIGMVVNTMAGMLTGSVFGWIFAGVVFVGVHLFNIAINALGAYVHSSRLQYVEYFGKFFEDGGRDFKPFKISARYHEVLPEINNKK
ncbi:MAG: V-type ATP synthase subunit I [Clostridiales bacterium]|nr:V-type ATP synthase subunit I [Clostridiales bacterium]